MKFHSTKSIHLFSFFIILNSVEPKLYNLYLALKTLYLPINVLRKYINKKRN